MCLFVSLLGGDDQIVGVLPEERGVEDAEVGGDAALFLVCHELVAVFGVLGDDLGLLHVDSDGGGTVHLQSHYQCPGN